MYSAGGTWTNDDVIFYSTRDQNGGRSLFRIPAGGGEAELLLESNNEAGYITPEILPGTDNLLIVVRPGPGGGGDAREGSIALFSTLSGELRTLVRDAFRPQYVPSGHIVFVRGGDLWAVPFDLEQLETVGPEVLVVNNVQAGAYEGGAAYTVSGDGVLIYVPGGEISSALTVLRELIWVDRQGTSSQ